MEYRPKVLEDHVSDLRGDMKAVRSDVAEVKGKWANCRATAT